MNSRLYSKQDWSYNCKIFRHFLSFSLMQVYVWSRTTREYWQETALNQGLLFLSERKWWLKVQLRPVCERFVSPCGAVWPWLLKTSLLSCAWQDWKGISCSFRAHENCFGAWAGGWCRCEPWNTPLLFDRNVPWHLLLASMPYCCIMILPLSSWYMKCELESLTLSFSHGLYVCWLILAVTFSFVTVRANIPSIGGLGGVDVCHRSSMTCAVLVVLWGQGLDWGLFNLRCWE